MTIPPEVLQAIREEAKEAARRQWPFAIPGVMDDWERRHRTEAYALCYERMKVADWERERWIPVSEALPEPLSYNPGRSDDVYVWHGVGHARFITFYQHSTGSWYFANGGESITHWKPLTTSTPYRP